MHVRERPADKTTDVYILGRVDHVFKRHGKRFSTDDIEAQLLRHVFGPGATACWCVRPSRSPRPTAP